MADNYSGWKFQTRMNNMINFLLPCVIKHFREIEGYTTIDVGKQKNMSYDKCIKLDILCTKAIIAFCMRMCETERDKKYPYIAILDKL